MLEACIGQLADMKMVLRLREAQLWKLHPVSLTSASRVSLLASFAETFPLITWAVSEHVLG